MRTWLKWAARRVAYLRHLPRLREFRQLLSRSLNREKLAIMYLRGDGIEIGALHNPLRVPASARVSYVDRLPVATLLQHYPDLAGLKLVEPAILDDGETLATVAAGSQDFVIANHFLEHCQDPIGTLSTFFRVLREDGILYLALPDKRYTFDKERPVTPLSHLIKDHEEGPAWSRRQHFEEWTRFVGAHFAGPNARNEAEIQEHTEQLMRQDFSIHFHVWTQAEVLELLLALCSKLGFEIEVFLKNGAEAVSILRKTAASAAGQGSPSKVAQAA